MKKNLIVLSALLPILLIGCSIQIDSSSNDSSISQNSSSSFMDSSSFSSSIEDSSEEISSEVISSIKDSSEEISSEYFSSEELNSEDISSDYVSSEDLSSDNISSEVISSIKDSSEDFSSEEVSSEYFSSEELNSEDISSDYVSSEDLSSDNISSEEYSSENISSEQTSSEDAEVNKITLSRSNVFVVLGRSFQLEATIYPSSASTNISWSSDKLDIATVSSDGLVYGFKAGKATIKATTENGKTAECKIFVSDQATPAFYLIGTVGGVNIPDWNDKYATIPDTGGLYIIPDVEIKEGDEIYIYNPNTGKVLKDSQGRDYIFQIKEYGLGDFYFDILSATKRYLEFRLKTN